MPLDPNVHPWRADLAAAHLKGQVEAARFVEGVRRQARHGVTWVHGKPDAAAPQTSQLLYGESFVVYETRDGWAWGQCQTDGYVGYVRADDLSDEVVAPTHVVRALRSFRYAEPTFKIPPSGWLSMNSPVAVAQIDGQYAELVAGGWVFAAHLAPLGAFAPDHVATALEFLGAPYLWGGRSSHGIDCSGLAQAALARAGVAVERDCYLQERSVGRALADGEPRRRGDLAYFPGHVAILTDPDTVVHATAHSMNVCVEPLADVAARAGGINVVRRLEP